MKPYDLDDLHHKRISWGSLTIALSDRDTVSVSDRTFISMNKDSEATPWLAAARRYPLALVFENTALLDDKALPIRAAPLVQLSPKGDGVWIDAAHSHVPRFNRPVPAR